MEGQYHLAVMSGCQCDHLYILRLSEEVEPTLSEIWFWILSCTELQNVTDMTDKYV